MRQDAIREMLKHTIHRNEALVALKRWNEFAQGEVEAATSLEEIVAAYCLTPPEGTAAVAAKAKWDALSLAEVAAAATHEEVVAAYHRAPQGSASEAAAIRKMLEL